MDGDEDLLGVPTVAISVVIACLNGEDTLASQLNALMRQREAPTFEVIVADNGSTDRSVELARSFTDVLDICVVDASGVRGAAHARNVGVSAARGDIIAFCDADDEVGEFWINRAHAALAAGHTFIAGRVDTRKLNSPAVRRSRLMEQEEGLQHCGGQLGLANAGAGNMAVRRAAFERVGGFDESLLVLEDSDFCWRMQLAGSALHFVPDMVIHTRLRNTVRGMAIQGYRYGRSFAHLQRSYRMSPASTRSDALRHGGLGRALAGIGKVLKMGMGGVLWHGAWKLGYINGSLFAARAALPSTARTPRVQVNAGRRP